MVRVRNKATNLIYEIKKSVWEKSSLEVKRLYVVLKEDIKEDNAKITKAKKEPETEEKQ